MLNDIARVRRFNRAVTSVAGVLDASFLGRGRPLGVARVLNAVGNGYTDVAAIRDYLGLDSGLMSRLLRSLEDEGLVETVPHPDDARRRLALLTKSGRREFKAYEALSNTQAEDILSRHAARDALLTAMDFVASVLGRDRIVLEETDPRSTPAVFCLNAYYAELASRLKCGFDVSRSCDPEARDMMAPRGTFLVAISDTMPVGCVGLKGQGGPVAEIKRLWVAPAARGQGLAKRLLSAAEEAAASFGITCLRLDTNSALHEAIPLYRKAGYREIDRYNDDPHPDLFFEKSL